MGMNMDKKHNRSRGFQSAIANRKTTANSQKAERGYTIKVYSEKQKPLMLKIANPVEKEGAIKLVQSTGIIDKPSLKVYSLEQLPLLEQIAFGTIVSIEKRDNSIMNSRRKRVKTRSGKRKTTMNQILLNIRKRGGGTHLT